MTWYKTFEAVIPSRMANVVMPAFRSFSISRVLFAWRIFTTNSPTGNETNNSCHSIRPVTTYIEESFPKGCCSLRTRGLRTLGATARQKEEPVQVLPQDVSLDDLIVEGDTAVYTGTNIIITLNIASKLP